MKLRNVKLGKNGFCGPAAISAVTGLNTDKAADLLREAGAGGRRRRSSTGHRVDITGTYSHHLARAFRAAGYRMKGRRDLLKATRWRSRQGGYVETAYGDVAYREPHWVSAGETLGQWCERTEDDRFESGAIYLLACGNHWVLIQKNRFVCGQVRTVTNIWAKGVHRRAQVQEVYEISIRD